MSERLVLSSEARLGQVDAKMNYQSLPMEIAGSG